MADLVGAGSAGLGLFRVDRETGAVRYDPLAAEGWPAGAVTETRLDVLVRDAAGRLALGQVSVDVTRPSDAFDRLDLPGLAALYDLSAAGSVALDGAGKLMTLNDLSSAGAHAAQAASYNRPPVAASSYAAAALALPAAAGQMIRLPINRTGPALAAGQTVFAVVGAPITGNLFQYILDCSDGSTGFGLRYRDPGFAELFVYSAATGATAWGLFGGDAVAGGFPMGASLFLVQVDLIAGVGARMRVNGGAWATASHPGHDYVRTAAAAMVLGNALEGDRPWGGAIAEAAFLDGVLPDADAADYAADAMARWGIVA